MGVLSTWQRFEADRAGTGDIILDDCNTKRVPTEVTISKEEAASSKKKHTMFLKGLSCRPASCKTKSKSSSKTKSSSTSGNSDDMAETSSKKRTKLKGKKKSKKSKTSSRSGQGGAVSRTLFKKKKKARGKKSKSSSSLQLTPSGEAAATAGQKVVKARTPRSERSAQEGEQPGEPMSPAVEGKSPGVLPPQAEQPIGAVPAEMQAAPVPERAAAAGMEMRADGPVVMGRPGELALEAKEDGGLAVKSNEAQTGQLRLDSQPDDGHHATAGFQAVARAPSRSLSRSRRRSTSRSAIRLQIPQGCNLVTPLFIRSFQSVRVDPETEELLITTNVVLHSSGLTVEERKAELDNLIQVRPAVVNIKTMDDDGFQEEKTTQNVLIGKSMIVVERKSVLLRSEQDSGLRTNDTRKYDNICEARMGPAPESNSTMQRASGILNVIAENGTVMEDEIYHKTERIVFNIGGVSFALNEGKVLPARCDQTVSQKNNVRFDERIFADQNSITIDRDTVIDAKNGRLWDLPQTFLVEEKRSYDYQSTYPDGSLVWTNAVPPLREEETQRSEIVAVAVAPVDQQQQKVHSAYLAPEMNAPVAGSPKKSSYVASQLMGEEQHVRTAQTPSPKQAFYAAHQHVKEEQHVHTAQAPSNRSPKQSQYADAEMQQQVMRTTRRKRSISGFQQEEQHMHTAQTPSPKQTFYAISQSGKEEQHMHTAQTPSPKQTFYAVSESGKEDQHVHTAQTPSPKQALYVISQSGKEEQHMHTAQTPSPKQTFYAIPPHGKEDQYVHTAQTPSPKQAFYATPQPQEQQVHTAQAPSSRSPKQSFYAIPPDARDPTQESVQPRVVGTFQDVLTSSAKEKPPEAGVIVSGIIEKETLTRQVKEETFTSGRDQQQESLRKSQSAKEPSQGVSESTKEGSQGAPSESTKEGSQSIPSESSQDYSHSSARPSEAKEGPLDSGRETPVSTARGPDKQILEKPEDRQPEFNVSGVIEKHTVGRNIPVRPPFAWFIYRVAENHPVYPIFIFSHILNNVIRKHRKEDSQLKAKELERPQEPTQAHPVTQPSTSAQSTGREPHKPREFIKETKTVETFVVEKVIQEDPGSMRGAPGQPLQPKQQQPVTRPVPEEEQLHTATKPDGIQEIVLHQPGQPLPPVREQEEIQEIVLRQPEESLHTARGPEKPTVIQEEPALHTAREPEKPLVPEQQKVASEPAAQPQESAPKGPTETVTTTTTTVTTYVTERMAPEQGQTQQTPVTKPAEDEQLHTARRPEEIQDTIPRQPEQPLHTAREPEKPKVIQEEPVLHTAREKEKPLAPVQEKVVSEPAAQPQESAPKGPTETVTTTTTTVTTYVTERATPEQGQTQQTPVPKPVEDQQLHTARKPEKIQEAAPCQPQQPLHTAREPEKPKVFKEEPVLHTAKESEKPLGPLQEKIVRDPAAEVQVSTQGQPLDTVKQTTIVSTYITERVTPKPVPQEEQPLHTARKPDEEPMLHTATPPSPMQKQKVITIVETRITERVVQDEKQPAKEPEQAQPVKV
ncbi:hypothetical protein Y032_0064g3557 [Ancylostoma ceylanicum]|nr:hypothetical protein Y032_0064g3557 [Ancylostoma ceylanicum]